MLTRLFRLTAILVARLLLPKYWFNLRKIDRLVELVQGFGCEVILHRTSARGDAEAVAGSGE